MIVQLLTATVNVNPYPFDEQLLLTSIQAFVPLILSGVMLIFLWKFLPKLMFQIYNKIGNYERSYQCKCARCQAELRTKKGLKIWKRFHKYDKRDWQ